MTTKKKAPVKEKTHAKKKPVKKPSKTKSGIKPGKKTNKKQKTYVAIVLDNSGSMATVAPETISSSNDQIETIKKESVGMDTRVILTLFNTIVSPVFFNVPVDKLQPLTGESYISYGWTAMYDGICKTVDRMEKELSDINDP